MTFSLDAPQLSASTSCESIGPITRSSSSKDLAGEGEKNDDSTTIPTNVETDLA